MTWKGHSFVAEDAPVSIRQGDPAALEAWCAENTARYAIVHHCPHCGEPVVAEEIIGHRLIHTTDNARAVIRSVLAMTPEEIAEVVAVVRELTDA